MKKLYYLIVLTLILGLVLTGCSLLSNIGQAPATEQSGITYLTKGLPSSLVGWWRFSDDVTDSSSNGNHGTFLGGGVATYSNSLMGRALSFDGDDYVRVVGTSSLIGITSEITVEAWIMFSNISDAFYVRTPFDLSPKAWGLDRYGGELRFYIYDGTTPIICKIAWTPEMNQWYHIAGTYNGQTLKLYVNKNLFQSLEYTGNINSTDQGVVIGARHSDGGWGYLRGLLDDVRIWNVALPENQLGKVYDFKGFFPPVDNDDLDDLNVAKAGRAIPVKFSLDGDQGLEIFEVNYPEVDYPNPKSIQITCEGMALDGDEIGTVTAGESSLNYDATADQYIYVWKTVKDWAGTCRKLVVLLNDGTSHEANFSFK